MEESQRGRNRPVTYAGAAMSRERGKYYTATIRVGRRRLRLYYGTGPAADLAEALQQWQALRRKTEQEYLREQRTRRSTLEALLGQLDRLLKVSVEEHLVAAGYHRHRQGEWRKRRCAGERQEPVMDHVPIRSGFVPDHDGTSVDLLAGRIEEELLRLAAGDDAASRATLKKQVEMLRAGLGEGPACPLQGLLIRQVSLTWLEVTWLEGLLVRQSDLTGKAARELGRWLDRARRGHLAALKTLALVRRLLPGPAGPRLHSGPAAAGDAYRPASQQRRGPLRR